MCDTYFSMLSFYLLILQVIKLHDVYSNSEKSLDEFRELCFVLPYAGETLEYRLRTGLVITSQTISSYLMQILAGVNHLHLLGISHRVCFTHGSGTVTIVA